MKTKLAVKVVVLIALLALILGGYCFYLMTVPLSYDWVYVVLFGFIASIGVFITASITLLILVVRSRRSNGGSLIPPPVALPDEKGPHPYLR